MQYNRPPLILTDVSVTDAVGSMSLDDLPAPCPHHPLRLTGATPFMERLWRIALNDIESNIIETATERYFGAGASFGARIYTRDTSFSGLLGLNRLYPELMKQSLKAARVARRHLGFRVPHGAAVREIDAPWIEEPLDENAFVNQYRTNSYTRSSDDVVWLWCAENLFLYASDNYDWQWLYQTGEQCFEQFYNAFYDPEDGLYRGQAAFMGVHFPDQKANGYPREWSIADCLLAKPLSTNCLYVQGLTTMARVADLLGRFAHQRDWQARADNLKDAIRSNLRRSDGTFATWKSRAGKLADQRDALGTALAVLSETVTGGDASAALRNYPLTDAGAPLFTPFFPDNTFYHNNSAWPFVDTFLLKAMERTEDTDLTAMNAALLARTVRADGFHELVDFRNKQVVGSGHQLWTAAAFIDVCRRAGLVDFDEV